MKKETKENSKVIFIGEDRICQQVAYVLAIENYEIRNFDFLKNLTEDNKEKYRDYEFYVCEFKRKVRKLTKISVSNKSYKIQYLDDICHEIDREYFVNRRRNRKKLQLKRIKDKSIVYDFLRYIYHRLKGFKTIRAVKHLSYTKKINKEQLKWLKPSELFLYVLYAPVNQHVNCSLLESEVFLKISGELSGCCSALPFGNLLFDGEFNEIYLSTYARIVKLSSLNHSYCLCDFTNWCPYYNAEKNKVDYKNLKLAYDDDKISSMTVSIEKSCNLCCKSCRNKPYILNDASRKRADILVNKLLSSGCLDKTDSLIMAGQGEVFYSPYYRRLLETDLKRKNIYLLTNGTLFNKENWNLIKDKYETIDLIISIDAATKETYKKLRSGNFDVLLSNLRMISDLHRQRKIRNWSLNYVVQRDNYREMIAFVELGRSLGVDRVSFLKMGDWGHLARKEYLQKCMVIDESYLDYDLWKLLQDPIFQDPIVDLNGFTRYIEASNSRYTNK